MLNNDQPICKDCGTLFASNDNGSRCPNCGSASKVILAQLTIQLRIYMRWRMLGKRFGKRVFELISGHELFRKENRMVQKGRLVDKENDWYEEIIIDPKTGDVIHETKEKLSNHYGHGSAKPKQQENSND
jgi:hypothetical protein